MNLSSTDYFESSPGRVDEWLHSACEDLPISDAINSSDENGVYIDPNLLDNNWEGWESLPFQSEPISTTVSGSSAQSSPVDAHNKYSRILVPPFGATDGLTNGEDCMLLMSALSPSEGKRQSIDGDGHPRVQAQACKPKLSPQKTGNHLNTARQVTGSQGRLKERIPHNEVERKYRDGLNAHMERLKRAIPSLAQASHQSVEGLPKPSKVMILASAVDYIRTIERERAQLELQNRILREMCER